MTDIRASRRALLAGAGAMAALARAPAVAAPARKPNLLFIMADDMGYADLSCTGRPDYQTPRLDRLAAEGVRFLQGYANSAVCSATRAGLMTGRYQNRLAVGLEEPLGKPDIGLPPDIPSLPSLLRKQGYTSALIGKWHLGMLPKFGPLQSGYDHFWGFRGGGIDYFRHGFGNNRDLWDDDTKVDSSKGYITDLLGDRAIAMLEGWAKQEKPFLMSLHFNAPHWPWEGPDDQAESDRVNKPGGDIFDFDGGSLKTYAAMVTRLDFQIGRVLDRLQQLGLAGNTIVVFTSDNGGERYSDNYPFNGRKTELLEGGIRVPLIVRWPGHTKAGTTSDQVAISMDWLPTFLAIAGGTPDPAFPSDGMDLRSAIEGGAPVARTLCWRYLNLAQEACRDGDWKYLKILDNSFLFNVVDDPMERANHKDRDPERFARLKTLYADWNAKMLPLDPKANTWGLSGKDAADHYGVKENRTTPTLKEKIGD